MIDPNRVEEVFEDCLPDDEAVSEEEIREHGVPDGFVAVDCIVFTAVMDVAKTEEYRAEIVGWLLELPLEFRAAGTWEDGATDGGGGWSFLQACMTKDGEQWTGLHQTMAILFALGQVIGRVQCTLPREMWPVLPGGMPYYAILPEGAKVDG